MTNIDQRRAGLLFGSFTADALALGVHWIYDTNELIQKFESLAQFNTPGAESYHPNKRAGDQSHVGDQGIQLAHFIVREKRWDQTAFMSDWIAMWADYDDYFDHATKTTLSNSERGVKLNKAGSESSELAGPARCAPLIAFLTNQDEAAVVKAVSQQTELTHVSKEAFEASQFLAAASHRLLLGAKLIETIETTAPVWALEKAKSVLQLDAVEAITALGQSCSIKSALPAVIYLTLKHGKSLPKAFIENSMAGGDNCARALALGMLLGAHHGVSAIPADWIAKLNAKKELEAVLNS